MSKTLHILNGDSTLHLMRESGIAGDTLVWREVLSEGPVSSAFNSEEFWKEREAFLTTYFSLAEGEYKKAVRQPFEEKSQTLDQYDEIILWFEYDLFCQINMMALIHWLASKRQAYQPISLVCSGKLDDSGKLYGLSELKADQFERAHETRLKLNTREFQFASDFYLAYTSENLEDLFTYTILPSDEFIYISDAVSTHLKRFPYTDSGLTEIEQQIIQFVKAGVESLNELVAKLLHWQKHYGFGDLQYIKKIEGMKPLFQDFDKFELKTEPEWNSALKNLDRNGYLGGAALKAWQFDPKTQETVKTLA